MAKGRKEEESEGSNEKHFSALCVQEAMWGRRTGSPMNASERSGEERKGPPYYHDCYIVVYVGSRRLREGVLRTGIALLNSAFSFWLLGRHCRYGIRCNLDTRRTPARSTQHAVPTDLSTPYSILRTRYWEHLA